MGQSPPSSTYNYEGKGLPFLQGKAEFGEVFPAPIKFCTTPLKRAPMGSLLISVRAPVGDVNLALDEYCIGRGLAAVCPKDDVEAWFLLSWFRFAKAELEAESSGTTFKSINKDVLERFEVPRPSLPEQRAIVHVLRTVLRAKEATEKVIVATRQLKASLMKHLFTYGPVPFDQADKVALKETEIGSVPAHWQVEPLERRVTVQGGFAFKSSLYGPEGIPVVRISNVKEGGLVWRDVVYWPLQLDEQISRYLLSDGDVLISMTGDVGVVCGVSGKDTPCLLNQRVGRLVIDDSAHILPDYLHCVASRPQFKNAVSGAAFGAIQQNVSGSKIESLPIPLPPVEEQRQIAAQLAAVDAKLATEERRRRALDALFKSLLHHLMTGKVRVKDIGVHHEA